MFTYDILPHVAAWKPGLRKDLALRLDVTTGEMVYSFFVHPEIVGADFIIDP
jgi:hypothetical protein